MSVTIFDEPAINSPSLLSDLDKADDDRDRYARLITRGAIEGLPLDPYLVAGFTEAEAKRARLLAALDERIRRSEIARDAQKAGA